MAWRRMPFAKFPYHTEELSSLRECNPQDQYKMDEIGSVMGALWVESYKQYLNLIYVIVRYLNF